MRESIFLQPRDTPAGDRGRPIARRFDTRLPDDWAERAVDRLGKLALFLGIGGLIETVVGDGIRYLRDQLRPADEYFWDLSFSSLFIVVSFVFYFVVRSRDFRSQTLQSLGIAYLVGVTFLASVGDHSECWWRGGHELHGWPTACVIIILFPVVVPMPWQRALPVSLAMAATGPLSLFVLSHILKCPAPQLSAYLSVTVPEFFCAVLALVPVRIVHNLGVEISKARQLGAYELTEKLGEGGMGEVWKAEHRFLARPAAVKLIRPDRLGDPASESAVHAVQRFEREAQTTASLRSVHTVGLYDFGRSNLGALYYVMELLEGFDMETLVERFGPQPPARVVYWLEQVCHSLTEAHAKGLVHRDIKPANLFVCRYGCDFDFVKVLDFGMVSLQPSLAGQDANLTVEGRIHGTPAYLAPEVVTGDAQPDAQSDIYALGCVAYFLLSGELVFKGKTPVEVIVGHVERAPAPLSQVAEQTIPVAFERLVLQCLAKNPTERPDGVEAVMVALEGCRGDDLWAAEQARQWWETHAEGVERSSSG